MAPIAVHSFDLTPPRPCIVLRRGPSGPSDEETAEFVVRIYLAGPIFTTPEREWNAGLAARLRAGGHEVFVPQDHPVPERTGRAILGKNLKGLDWADTVVATMDGADPDSGTSWECGYAYARGKTVVLFRSDFRGSGDERDIPYNGMLIGSADANIELELATVDEAAAAILTTLAGRSKR